MIHGRNAELRLNDTVIALTDWNLRVAETEASVFRYRREVVLKGHFCPAPAFFAMLVESRAAALTHNILPAVTS